MRRLRVLCLMHDYLVPPEDDSKYDISVPWKTEFDVKNTLQVMGHEVRVVGVADDLSVMRNATKEFAPHIVFNLMENFTEVGVFDQNIVSYLELLKVPYTGCNPRGLMLSRDKALAKQLLSYHRIPVPDFTVFRVMFSAIVTAMLGTFWLSRLGMLDLGRVYVPETWIIPQLVGGAIFGVGFAIAGLCPGTACVSAATGRGDGMVTVGGFFVGQIMKATRGTANPGVVNELLDKVLAESGS